MTNEDKTDNSSVEAENLPQPLYTDDDDTFANEPPPRMDEDGIRLANSHIDSIIKRLANINTAIAIGGAVVVAIISITHLTGFIAGVLIGIVNQRLSMRIVRRAFRVSPEDVKGFVTLRYYTRFLFVVLVMGVLIGWTKISPWGLLVGFSLILITTIGAIYMVARNEDYA
jgi:hypothetical protein